MTESRLELRWAWLIGIITITAAASGWFQAVAPPAEVPAPTIRVSTHLVLVDVVVTDKHGKPITGLHPEDFVVQEKGRTQKVAFFSWSGESSRPPAPILPPGIYSNKPEYRSPGGPLVILLLDAANTPFKDQAYARQQMLKFVKDEYKPDQRMAIFTLTNSLGVLQDFTSDPDVLLKALQRYQPLPQEMANASSPRPVSTSSDGGGGAQLASDGLLQQMRDF